MGIRDVGTGSCLEKGSIEKMSVFGLIFWVI